MVELVDQGHAARAARDVDGAIARYLQAEQVVRELIDIDPEDLAAHRQLGTTLYALGEALLADHRSRGEVVTVLDRAERAYTSAAASDAPSEATTALLVADVEIRRARAHAAHGYAASAVVDAQDAVLSYLDRFTWNDTDPLTLDVARVLAWQGWVLLSYGDPDVALAAAESALGLYAKTADDTVEDHVPKAPHDLTFSVAAAVAERIHTAYGRHDQARAAGRLVARTPYVLRPSRAPQEIPETMLTLAEALDRAGASDLRSALVTPGSGKAIVSSMHRCTDRQAALESVVKLGTVSMQTVDDDPSVGLRTALEAHALYQGVARRQPDHGDDHLGEVDQVYVACLFRCSMVCRQHGYDELARDLSDWMVRAAEPMVPQAVRNGVVRSLVLPCLDWHVDLLAEIADEAGIERWARTARLLRERAHTNDT